MADITATENKFLNELVKDCITYRLTESEALEYIKQRFHSISLTSYKKRKSNIKSDNSTNLWLNDFTRIGFVKNHKEDIECINKLRNDSMHQLQIEMNRKVRNEQMILQLKENVIETTKLLVDLNLGTPIISAIKAKLDSANKNKQNAERIQIR